MLPNITSTQLIETTSPLPLYNVYSDWSEPYEITKNPSYVQSGRLNDDAWDESIETRETSL
jgi:hypothetical protein